MVAAFLEIGGLISSFKFEMHENASKVRTISSYMAIQLRAKDGRGKSDPRKLIYGSVDRGKV